MVVETDQQGERVVRGVVGSDIVDHHAVQELCLRCKTVTVDRVGLEDHQSVEESADARGALHVGQAEVMVIEQSRLFDLNP